jgi:hypothetical protein
MTPDLPALATAVQRNCHISDARHAGNYTLCVYLLKMREFFRWEQSQAFGATLSNADIGQWLTEREALWNELENADYAAIDTPAGAIDPFESAAINRHLLPAGLVYSGGIGFKSKPHFYLAELEREEHHGDYHILVSGREFARDLTSPPAMSQGRTVYMRRESFQRMIWERIEEWRWNRPENAMAAAIGCYDFDTDVETALAAMTDNELEAAILHEIGEIRAGERLPGWGDMMVDISFTKAEIMARAVRDHLADLLSTLPTLLQQDHAASIHFWFANLTNMRKHIFPTMQSAYARWREDRDTRLLRQLVSDGLPHWQGVAEQMLAIHRHGDAVSDRIETLVTASHL